MYKILVFGMTENPGGVESFIINYYRHIDRRKIQFDFLCNSYEPIAYEEEVKRLGGRCFHIIARHVDYRKYVLELEKVFREYASEWDAIWVNVCSLANVDYLKEARKYKIKKRIIHSHNSQNMDSKLRGILHWWNKKKIGKLATDFWACSEDAARWFYSDKELKRAVIIHNAIDIEHVQFDVKKRETIRKKYCWGKKYVIGNVGRLHFQKNQSFMLDIFYYYYKKHSDSVLVLVGQGEDEKMLKDKAAKLKLSTAVFWAGVQSDIQAWLSSFDLFLFPSKFEGLGIAALEAQVNGLPVLASAGVIPQEVKINNNFLFCELEDGAEVWSQKIDKMQDMEREDFKAVRQKFIDSGYDIEAEVEKVEELLQGQGEAML